MCGGKCFCPRGNDGCLLDVVDLLGPGGDSGRVMFRCPLGKKLENEEHTVR